MGYDKDRQFNFWRPTIAQQSLPRMDIFRGVRQNTDFKIPS